MKEEQKKISEEKSVVKAEISNEMKSAYIDYAMSVIVSRALPSVEDGLKPVHRRILYTMNSIGLEHNKPTKKCARIVGDVLGKFHPHGDVAVYDALIRMGQDFSLRYPLVHGQGNFGSIDGDPPAAMRYTEAKLSKIASELLEDIDKNTVEFIPNFDNSLKEPTLLPAKLPNLLINGATGIAVGMATNIPPHNLVEVCDAIIRLIEKPNVEIKELREIIKGPDFPTGGQISSEGLDDVYTKGKGSFVIRGKIVKEETKTRENLVITEIPYMVNKSELINQIANLTKDKGLEISDLRDESAKGKIRIVLEPKKGANIDLLINKLFKYTRLQEKFDAIMLALVNGKPQILDLKKFLECYIQHRKNVIIKRTKFDLTKAEDRIHIVQGLLFALSKLDDIISFIRKSKNTTDALNGLQERFKLSKKQSEAILQMKLQQLTALEHDKLKSEEKELEQLITKLKKILGSESEILSIIKKELNEIKKEYGDERRTNVIGKMKEFTEEQLIKKEEVVITITEKGYVKRLPVQLYKEQHRGGRGIIGTDLVENDFIKQIIVCSTHDYLLLFTDRGRVFWLRAYNIPETVRQNKGKALVNILDLKNEKVNAVLPIAKFENFVFMVTKKGIVKKISLKEFSNPQKRGIKAINLPIDGSDSLIDVQIVTENQEVLIATKLGKAIRFSAVEVRPMGRASYGITGVKLDKNDSVVSLEVLPESEAERKKESLLTITTKGFGKRSEIEDYRSTGRAVKGVININITDKTGEVVGTTCVKEGDSFIVITSKGMVIRSKVEDVRVMSRNTQGVRIIKIEEEDRVIDIAKVQKEDIS